MPSTDVKDYLGEGKPLSHWIDVCKNTPGRQYWLLAKDEEENDPIRLESVLYPVVGNTGELNDDEYDEYDSSIHENGYFSFLNLDQLEDIISNLTMQKSEHSSQDILKAINYYFDHDAFLTL